MYQNSEFKFIPFAWKRNSFITQFIAVSWINKPSFEYFMAQSRTININFTNDHLLWCWNEKLIANKWYAIIIEFMGQNKFSGVS